VSKQYVYGEQALLEMKRAVYGQLEDASFSGRIPGCPGVPSFARSQGNPGPRYFVEEREALGGYHRFLPVSCLLDSRLDA